MRKLSLLLFGAAISAAALAQVASVPTSWDCSGTPPTGWSQVQTGTPGNLNYTSQELYTSAPSSARLDFTGEYILININDAPGLVKYNIKGSVGSGSWSGTFKSQWSVDGTAWTDMRIYTTLPVLSNPFVNAVDTPSSQARFIRLFFATKDTGNVALDDISVELPVAGAAQEIDAKFKGAAAPLGSTVWFSSPVSTPAGLKLKVYNLGSDSTLTLSNAAITGAASADFLLGSYPSSIAPKDSGEVNFTFNPSIAGTRVAKLSFNNNDADENPYEINLNGIGGDYATEPSQNPTALTFSNVKSYGFKATVAGNNADGYLVLRKLGSAVTETPVDGTVYTLGEGVGASKVFYVGNAANFNVKEVRAGLTYHFAVFSFNGNGNYINYKQLSPLVASQASGNGAPGSYYTAINSSASTFVSDLGTLINNRTLQFYSSYKATMIDGFYARDTADGKKAVNCEYSNELVQYTEPFDFTGLDMAREHTFASSWMPTFGKAGHSERYGYSDYHNLHLANQTKVNDPRSNFGFGDVTTVTSTYFESKLGKDATNRKVFQPRDEIKGDVARSIFYMSTCYQKLPNRASASSSLQPVTNAWQWDSLIVPGVAPNPDLQLYLVQDEALLKQWSQADPPSAEEIARNEFVFDLQGNRNPFIDNPDWVCYINFKNMTYNAAGTGQCYTTSVKEVAPFAQVEVYPSPATSLLNVTMLAQQAQTATVQLVDMVGKVVYSAEKELAAGVSNFNFSVANFATGNYILKVSGNGTIQKKIQIQK